MKKVLLTLVVASALGNALHAMTVGDVSNYADLSSSFCRDTLKGNFRENEKALLDGINNLNENYSKLTQAEINKRVDALEKLFKAFAEQKRNYKASIGECIRRGE